MTAFNKIYGCRIDEFFLLFFLLFGENIIVLALFLAALFRDTLIEQLRVKESF